MAATFADLLNDFAAELNLTRTTAVAVSPITVPGDLWTQRAVAFINRALRWAWIDDDPRFIWPQTVTVDASVAVVNNIIAWSEVGNSDWVSFWQSDPRIAGGSVYPSMPYYGWAYGPNVPPVPVTWDGAQFNIQAPGYPATIFAFYRAAVPQGTFVVAASSPTYVTPTVPSFFRDAVVKYAVAEYYASTGSSQELDYRAQALTWYTAQKASILNSDAATPWLGNIINT